MEGTGHEATIRTVRSVDTKPCHTLITSTTSSVATYTTRTTNTVTITECSSSREPNADTEERRAAPASPSRGPAPLRFGAIGSVDCRCMIGEDCRALSVPKFPALSVLAVVLVMASVNSSASAQSVVPKVVTHSLAMAQTGARSLQTPLR